MVDKYTHSNLVYYKHNGNDESYDLGIILRNDLYWVDQENYTVQKRCLCFLIVMCIYSY